MNNKPKILIVGLFLSEKNKVKILRTAADQLAELLTKNGFSVIKVSNIVNKWLRFADTLGSIFFKAGQYQIAIVPLYGGSMSLLWARASVRLLKILNKKIVLIVHGGSIPARMKIDSSRYFYPLKKADVVVFPSTYMQSSLKEYGIYGQVIPNVVKTDDYSFQKKEKFRPHILWMRTLEDIYNPEMAVRVASLLDKKYSKFKMMMAGYDHGALQFVQQLAHQLQIEDCINFPGYINNFQKNEYAKDYDIYICTNRVDNAPVSFIEMMCLGLPIVSVNVGGIPHLLQHNVSGLMVDLDDDEAMFNSICSIIDKPELGKMLVKNSLDYTRNFAEKTVIEKWKALFDKLSIIEEPQIVFKTSTANEKN